MADDKKNTTILSSDNPLLQRAINQQSKDGTDELSADETREFLILIRGMVERVEISEGDKVIFGRFDLKATPQQIDLTPYGAGDRGVSREHAQIHIAGDTVYLTDLGSTNGTHLRGERLEPRVATALQKGNEILLGRLSLQVVFR